MPIVSQALERVREKNPGEPAFLQSVTEVLESLRPVLERNKRYRDANLLDRITEPERIIIFRVPWQDDKGNIHVNRGFRVEFSSAIGPTPGSGNDPVYGWVL